MAHQLHQGLVEDTANPGTFVADPVALPTVPASPTDATAVDTTGATNSSPYGFTTAAQADAIVTQLNIVIAALVAAGFLS